MKEELTEDVDIPKSYSIDYITMSDGGQLRRLYFHPENPVGTVLLYPGMNTLVLSWEKVLKLLCELNYKVEYVESREKYTAILDKRDKVTKERMLLDNKETIEILKLKDTEYIAIGSSLGSSTLIHNMANKSIAPPNVILVGPSLEFKLPQKLMIILYFFNDFIYNNFGKKIIKKILLGKYTNKEKDPHQYRKYSLALDLANFGRLKKSIRSWQHNRLHEDLPLIDGSKSKCYLIGASEDKLHPDTDTIFIAENIANAEYIDLKTNTAAHDTPLIEFIQKITK